MIIGFKKKFLFIHVPKCAGDSISELLLDPENGGAQFLRKHATFGEAERVMDCRISEFVAFAVVRNPFAQVASFYDFLRKPLRIPRDSIERQYPGTGGRLLPVWASELAMQLPFAEYIKAVYVHGALSEKPQGAWFFDFLSWLVAAEGAFAPVRVLRFERLSRDFAELAAELGLTGVLPWRNASRQPGPAEDYRPRYDSESRRILEAHFAPTLERFGYCFDLADGEAG